MTKYESFTSNDVSKVICKIEDDGFGFVSLKQHQSIQNTNKAKETLDFLLELDSLRNQINKGSVFCEIIAGDNPSFRDTSIGVIKKMHLDSVVDNIIRVVKMNLIPVNELIQSTNQYPYYHPVQGLIFVLRYDPRTSNFINFLRINEDSIVNHSFVVEFDSKHKEKSFVAGKVKILPNYTGSTKYVNQAPTKKTVDYTMMDKFDREIKLGSFICFAITGGMRQQGSPKFGKITKIHSPTHFKAENIKLHENDYKNEYTLRDPKEVILMDDELMSNLVLAKLSY